MKLAKIHVTEFQSIIDSNEFEVNDITCLVGKNEAGKSAILKAIYRLNPIISSDGKYDVTKDYPRRDVEDYKQDIENKERKLAKVINATFQIDESTLDEVRHVFGPDSIVVLSQDTARNVPLSARKEIIWPAVVAIKVKAWQIGRTLYQLN